MVSTSGDKRSTRRRLAACLSNGRHASHMVVEPPIYVHDQPAAYRDCPKRPVLVLAGDAEPTRSALSY